MDSKRNKEIKIWFCFEQSRAAASKKSFLNVNNLWTQNNFSFFIFHFLLFIYTAEVPEAEYLHFINVRKSFKLDIPIIQSLMPVGAESLKECCPYCLLAPKFLDLHVTWDKHISWWNMKHSDYDSSRCISAGVHRLATLGWSLTLSKKVMFSFSWIKFSLLGIPFNHPKTRIQKKKVFGFFRMADFFQKRGLFYR